MNSFFDKKMKIRLLLLGIGFVLFSFIANSLVVIGSNYFYYSAPEILANSIQIAEAESTGRVRMVVTPEESSDRSWMHDDRNRWFLHELAGVSMNNTAVYVSYENPDLTEFIINWNMVKFDEAPNVYGFPSQPAYPDLLGMTILQGEIGYFEFSFDYRTGIAVSSSFAQNLVDRGIVESLDDVVGQQMKFAEMDISLQIDAIVADGFLGNNYAEKDSFIVTNFDAFGDVGTSENINMLFVQNDYYNNFSTLKYLFANFRIGWMNVLMAPGNEWMIEELTYIQSLDMSWYVAPTIIYFVAMMGFGFFVSWRLERKGLGKYKGIIFGIMLIIACLTAVIPFLAFNHIYLAGFHISSRLSYATILEFFGVFFISLPTIFIPGEEPKTSSTEEASEEGENKIYIRGGKGYEFVKRAFDIFASLLAIIVLSPIFLIFFILVKCTTKGPAIYKDERLGKGGKVIYVYKFRSMYVDAEARIRDYLTEEEYEIWLKERKLDHDPRITKIGKFIRKTSIDELPQLFNILGGSLSFIGPRAITAAEWDEHFTKEEKEALLSITPGLSGYWAAHKRNEVNFLSGERQKLELAYLSKRGVWEDIKLLFMTVITVFKGRGAK